MLTAYGMDDLGSSPCTRNILSLLHSVQTGFGSAQYPIKFVLFSIEVNLPEPEVDHSLSSSADAKNGGAIPPLLHMSSFLFYHTMLLVR
jgi:hypothetical protein